MDILSYRGPGTAGGVSGAISRILERHARNTERWWYLSYNALMLRYAQSLSYVCNMTEKMVEGHYRYCNNFLWPIMHDMPEYASYSADDRTFYQQFNLSFACNVLHSEHVNRLATCFVHDYQLALVPKFLSMKPGIDTSVFWHIPWPKEVPEVFVPLLVEVAEGLLTAATLGFHTAEYVANFLDFVDSHLRHYSVDFPNNRVVGSTGETSGYSEVCRNRPGLETQLVVRPLGVDTDFWTRIRKEIYRIPPELDMGRLSSVPFVLSVDRADYTKGVLERLEAIDRFFIANPGLRGRVTFVQICQRTRVGLPLFDRYWQDCKNRADQIQGRWGYESWQPIIWMKKPVPQTVLSQLYGKAAAMLVNPVRDGLNLTAKEFVACLEENPGALLLSPGAGVWDELGRYSVRVDPLCVEGMVAGIEQALALPLVERNERVALMRERLKANTLAGWWQQFVEERGLKQQFVRTLDRNLAREAVAL